MATRPVLTIRYDLRSPPFARSHRELYAAMLDQARWADRVGFDSVVFSEHHASADGYLPSPLMTAAAVAGATSRIRVSVSALLLPLYDLVRLAEDVAVVDRRAVRARGAYRSHHSGAGSTRRPMIFLGGSSVAAARRAARLADGFFPVDDRLSAAYVQACADLGKAPGPTGGPKGPMFIHVSNDPDRAWAQIAPHALYETNSYGQWLSVAGNAGPYAEAADGDALRARGNYVVLTPDECITLARQQGSLTLHPLMGGLDPEIAAESLELVENPGTVPSMTNA